LLFKSYVEPVYAAAGGILFYDSVVVFDDELAYDILELSLFSGFSFFGAMLGM